MRRPRCPAPLLPLAALLLLLAMHCAGGCLAAAPALNHRCNFDEAMRKSGPLPTAVVREVPRRGEGAAQAYGTTTPPQRTLRTMKNAATMGVLRLLCSPVFLLSQ
ncbi:surface protease GP63 [Trypanosoma conorhini]|uniref:Surface protease GP63 n=1 Tax=Trypanosoma conorhini TaxID=83891 RepID=A0A422N0C9_9TRYP|nr:surface protease GP63 [Trypanosoma conorhini]RNE98914.1 surface protease GP63 [Trypanosoma conorhini]